MLKPVEQRAAGAGPLRVLRIDASMRNDGSTTRALADQLIAKLTEVAGSIEVVRRDLAAETLPPVDQAWIGANFTDPDARTDEQKAALAQSDALIDEVKAADVLVIAAPIYNFGVPAALKAWIDLICRARVTFRYTENGPVGLLEGKKGYLVMASGGTPVDSPVDFATPHLRHIMGFIGIHDVEVVAAARHMADEGARAAAEAEIEALRAA